MPVKLYTPHSKNLATGVEKTGIKTGHDSHNTKAIATETASENQKLRQKSQDRALPTISGALWAALYRRPDIVKAETTKATKIPNNIELTKNRLIIDMFLLF
jgi:hypothetical protein